MNKLLIVEDDIAFANTLMRRLEKNNFSCVHAMSNNAALLACRQNMPNYILLDMKLGDESSLAIIKPLRALRPQAKIVLLTGFASIATAVDAIKLGADDYLTKPVSTQALLAALDKPAQIIEATQTSEATQTLSTEQVEWQHIQQVLKFNNGNVSETARQLSMHRRTLQRKLQKRPSGASS